MKVEKEMNKKTQLLQLSEKIKNGIQESYQRFLEEAQFNNQDLVLYRNNKVVLVPTREIKLRK